MQTGTCVDQCSETQFAKIEQNGDMTLQLCVNDCDTQKEAMLNGMLICVDSCPSTAPFISQDGKACTDDCSYFNSNNECID